MLYNAKSNKYKTNIALFNHPCWQKLCFFKKKTPPLFFYIGNSASKTQQFIDQLSCIKNLKYNFLNQNMIKVVVLLALFKRI
jgi:hypothetical protein